MKSDKLDFRYHYPLERYRSFLENHRKRGLRAGDARGQFEQAVWHWLRARSAERLLLLVPGAEGRQHPWAEAWARLLAGGGADPLAMGQAEPAPDCQIVTAGMADCLIDPVVKHREEAHLPIEARHELLVQRVVDGNLPHDGPLKYGRSVDPLTGERLRVDIEGWRPRLGAIRRVNGRHQFVHVA